MSSTVINPAAPIVNRSSVGPPTPVSRPPDVVDAAARYRPHFPMLGDQDARSAVQLVEQALAGLEPHVVVNRSREGAIRLLSGQDALLRTAFDRTDSADPHGASYRARRGALEAHYGTHGHGQDAGHTVYGSVHWTTPGSLPDRSSIRSAFGPVSLLLDERVLDRSTFLAGDSFPWTSELPGAGLRFRDEYRTGAREQLGAVVAERLARTYGVDPGELPAGEAVRPMPAPSAPFLSLLRQPAADAVRLLREEILAHPEQAAVEAHVRGVGAADVDTVVVARGPNRTGSHAASEDERDELDRLIAARGMQDPGDQSQRQ